VLTEKLESMNLEELAELKKEVAAFIKTKKEGDKERRAAEKQKKAEWAKENLEEDDLVTFSYKGEILEGSITKLNDKSFTVAFEYEGEDKVLSRLYHLLIEKIDEDEDETAA